MQYRIDKNSKENQKKQLHKNIINNTNKIIYLQIKSQYFI